MPASVSVTGGSTSVQSGQRALAPYTLVGSADISETIVMPLAAGDNSFSVPTGAYGCVICPFGNETTGTVWKLRYNLNTADVGLPLSILEPTLLNFPTPAPSQLILNTSAAQTQPVTFWFF